MGFEFVYVASSLCCHFLCLFMHQFLLGLLKCRVYRFDRANLATIIMPVALNWIGETDIVHTQVFFSVLFSSNFWICCFHSIDNFHFLLHNVLDILLCMLNDSPTIALIRLLISWSWSWSWSPKSKRSMHFRRLNCRHFTLKMKFNQFNLRSLVHPFRQQHCLVGACVWFVS